MKNILSSLISFMLILTSSQAEDSVPPIIPLRDFFRNPETTGYEVSPSGELIGFLKPVDHRLNVWVQPKSGGEAKQITNVKDRDIRGFFWKGDKYVLYLKDNGGDENYHLYVAQSDGSGSRDLTPFEGVRAEMIDDLEDDPTDLIIGLNQRNKEVFDAYRLNIETGNLKLIAENPGNISSWTTDHAGNIRVATTTDGVNTTLLYRKTEQDTWKPVITTNFKETFTPQFFTFDNKDLYGVSNIGRDKAAIVEFDPETGKETNVLFDHPEVDVSDLHYSKKRKVITSASYTTWKEEKKFFDPVTEQLYKTLEGKLPGYDVYVVSSNKAEDTFVVRTITDRSLGSFYLYEANSGKLTKLADRNPWLKEDQLTEMKPIEYKSRDGLTIHGYLTLPKGKPAKDLPIVVNPHGGPWVRDEWGFNPEVQFLANRGFGVLQMNYRGSTGYGRNFWEAGFKQWGQSMQDDITDGVKWLIDQGIADPKRVAIYGGSYGGYAVLEGLTKTPDLYAAGVDYVGVSNLFTFMKTVPPYWKPFLDMMYEMVGNPDKDKALFEENSPALNADRIKAPLFVAQGAKDPRVNIDESNQIVNALKKRGIDVEYMVKENEGHGFHNEENRFSFYEAMESFLAKHLISSSKS
ncbi:MAG: S9 family peptidase [Verrucomicrobia bacterium]|nr:S9 family peptidase [Verrucomicrobiota bacterium]